MTESHDTACCRLDFVLTVTEVESGDIKWDLGRPYFIRHLSDGRCAHHDAESGGCSIYASRSGVYRGYSCASDTRIWKNFEQMEANAEWIEANRTAQSQPHVTAALMHDTPGVTLRRVTS